MRLEPALGSNTTLYHRLAQSYEAEFSALTLKLPGSDGLFALDTDPEDPQVIALIAFEGERPLGIAAIGAGEHFEMREFYVLPCYRKQGNGRAFAHAIWREHPGIWEIKQLPQAAYATRFWRSVLAAYGLEYREDRFDDPYWGLVIRQRFETHLLQ